MTSRERFEAVLNRKPVDRAPAVEWAGWWNLTYDRWYSEGLPRVNDGTPYAINRQFGQDKLWQIWFPIRTKDCPTAAYHGAPVLEDPEKYGEFRERYLYRDEVLEEIRKSLDYYLKCDPDGEYAFWYTLEGFFWYPRTLFGIEEHLYAFYDYDDVMLQMNRDVCDFYKKVLEIVYEKVQPQFMTFAEDMSYNNGPMISHELYQKFMAPFYNELIPFIKSKGTKVFIDTDGGVEPLIPWFLECGIEGVIPLERQAGVDVNRIRTNYPEFLMIGGYDKTIMKNGEEAMRAEFERLKPAIQSGGYIPSVDHQTPPDVSLENYRTYMKLLKEYTVYE